MKRIVAVLLCLALLIGSVYLPGQEQEAQAVAYDEELSKVVIDGVTYVYQGVKKREEIEINAIFAPKNITKLTIPAEIDGKPVTQLAMYNGGGAVELPHVTSLTFSKNMVYTKTFFTCIPDPYAVYYGYSMIKSLEYYFTGLEEVQVDSANPYILSKNGIVYSKDMKEQIHYPYAKKDKEYKEPDTIETSSSYEGRKYLKKLTFSSNKKSQLFGRHCADSGLETVVLPSHITSIPWECFRNCTNLKTVDFPEGLQGIRDDAFHGCSRLKNVKLPGSIRYIDDYAFMGTKIKKIIIPDSVLGMGKKVFSETTKVTRPPYLKSAKAKYTNPDYYKYSAYKYRAMVTLTKKKTGKKKRYPAKGIAYIWGKERVTLKRGKTYTLTTKAEVVIGQDEDREDITKSGIVAPDILYYKIPKNGVISITKKGKIKALRKGTATIYVGVRVENSLEKKVGYKVKVKVK